ncbi:MAG: hypothetical protein ACK55F_01820 [Acidobacteriota bacterium]
MRRVVGSLAVLLLLATVCCQARKRRLEVLVDDTEPADVREQVAANDASVSGQLVRGFYEVESGAWRWTMPRFAIRFRVPAGAREKGAVLRAALVLPDVIFRSTGPVTLAVSAAGKRLDAQTMTVAGNHSLAWRIPAAEMVSETITLEFSLDKEVPPGAVDPRELGLIFLRADLSRP